MKIGEIYSRKDYEYTIVGVVYHKNTGVPIYTVQRRKYGKEEVDYFIQEGNFYGGYTYEGFILD